MDAFIPPVAVATVAAFIAIPTLLSQRRNDHQAALGLLDKFAREADLAVTSDVEPDLTALFLRRFWRLRLFLATVAVIGAAFVAATVEVLGQAFADPTVGAAGADPYRSRFALIALIAVACIALGAPLQSPGLTWSQPQTSALAHAQRTGIRDYVDPVGGWMAIAIWTSLAVFGGVLLVSPGRPAGYAPLALLFVQLAVTVEYLVWARWRLRQRSRAGTIQQLAFSDALISESLRRLMAIVPSFLLISVQFIAGNSSPSFALFVVPVMILPVIAILLNAARTEAAARRFKKRLYPGAPESFPQIGHFGWPPEVAPQRELR